MEEVIREIQDHIYFISFGICLLALVMRHRRFNIYQSSGKPWQIISGEGLFLLKLNLILGILFGVLMSLRVAFGSGDRSWWLMPLIMGPISYLSSVGFLAVAAGAALVLVAYSLKKR